MGLESGKERKGGMNWMKEGACRSYKLIECMVKGWDL